MLALSDVGLIGVGAMGEPVGKTLLKAGFALHVCAHSRRERVDRLRAAGAAEHKDPAAVADICDLVILMLPDSPQVEEVLFAGTGVLQGGRCRYVIDMSTLSPVASRSFNQRLAQRGIEMLDAPVSGGPARAASGQLTIMVGGDEATFQRCKSVLSALGDASYLGPSGMGETVKLVNQIIIGSVMQINAEALVFGKKAGADLQDMRRILSSATASNYLLEKWLPDVWFGGADHNGGFALDLLRKDLQAALDAAQGMDLAMPFTRLALERYTEASALGNGAKDYSVVAKLYERAAGVSVAD